MLNKAYVQSFASRVTAAILMAVILCGTANAEGISLQLKAGKLSIKGRLIAYDGTSYVIESSKLGVLTLEAARFNCVGANCPPTLPRPVPLPPSKSVWVTTGQLKTASVDQSTIKGVGIAGPRMIGERLVPALIAGYVKSIGGGLDIIKGRGADKALRLSRANGKHLTSLHISQIDASGSLLDLAESGSQLALLDRPIARKEIAALRKAGWKNLQGSSGENILALEAAAVIVSPKNQVRPLTIEEIGEIFSGEIKDWDAVGSNAGPIRIYALKDPYVKSGIFYSKVLKSRGLKFSQNLNFVSDEISLLEAVAKDPQAIAFTSIQNTDGAKAVKPVDIESQCGIIHRPSVFNAKAEEYPIHRRYYLYSKKDGKKRGPAGEIVNFMLSNSGQSLVSRIGFIGQDIEAQNFSAELLRIGPSLASAVGKKKSKLMKEFIASTRDAKRVSVTLRFLSSSSEFERKSKGDISRLAEILSLDALRKKEIVLMGFADASGAPDQNLKLSKIRAEKAKLALFTAAKNKIPPGDIIVKAFGDLAPVACNDTLEGRKKNRRVEIWIRDKIEKAPIPQQKSKIAVARK